MEEPHAGNHFILMDPFDNPDDPFPIERTRRQMGYVLSCAHRMDLSAVFPSNDFSKTTYCFANPGVEYLIYQTKPGQPFEVTLATGTYRYEWFNLATGEVVYTGRTQGNGRPKKAIATFDGEAVMYLQIE